MSAEGTAGYRDLPTQVRVATSPPSARGCGASLRERRGPGVPRVRHRRGGELRSRPSTASGADAQLAAILRRLSTPAATELPPTSPSTTTAGGPSGSPRSAGRRWCSILVARLPAPASRSCRVAPGLRRAPSAGAPTSPSCWSASSAGRKVRLVPRDFRSPLLFRPRARGRAQPLRHAAIPRDVDHRPRRRDPRLLRPALSTGPRPPSPVRARSADAFCAGLTASAGPFCHRGPAMHPVMFTIPGGGPQGAIVPLLIPLGLLHRGLREPRVARGEARVRGEGFSPRRLAPTPGHLDPHRARRVASRRTRSTQRGRGRLGVAAAPDHPEGDGQRAGVARAVGVAPHLLVRRDARALRSSSAGTSCSRAHAPAVPGDRQKRYDEYMRDMADCYVATAFAAVAGSLRCSTSSPTLSEFPTLWSMPAAERAGSSRTAASPAGSSAASSSCVKGHRLWPWADAPSPLAGTGDHPLQGATWPVA